MLDQYDKILRDEKILQSLQEQQQKNLEDVQEVDQDEYEEEGEHEISENLQKNYEDDYVSDKELNSSQLDEELENIEEFDEEVKKLKMPQDLEGSDDERFQYGDEFDDEKGLFGDDLEEGEAEMDEDIEEQEDQEDPENDVFALARETKEMSFAHKLIDKKPEKSNEIISSKKKNDFANQEMLDRIEKIETEMMDEKKWQMKGEVQCKDRAYNSLLEEYVDFDVASKMPPQITQETTNQIEQLIKQRILDEMFDDPVRRVALDIDNKIDDFSLNFTKSSKGLGEQYADDYQKKFAEKNPDVFLDDSLTGPDAGIKKEIDETFSDLMRSLNQLSNVNFVPKSLKKEAKIRTQNVPAIQLEEALPIGVSKAQTKTAREVFQIDSSALRTKEELSKEEKRRERAHRKRQIKSHLHHKEIQRKESNREKGIVSVGERFLVKTVQQQIDKKKKKEKKERDLGENTSGQADKNSNAYKSGKFFKNLADITKQDREKKDLKRSSKQTGKALESIHTNQNAKRFKI